MSKQLAIYGFGSYFHGCALFADIDILIVHQSGNYESCQFAIRSKQFLASVLSKSDITILSMREEQHLSFIAKSGALHIGNVFEGSEENDLCGILETIAQASAVASHSWS